MTDKKCPKCGSRNFQISDYYAVFDRQQAEKDMEKAYWEAQQQAEYEAEMRAYEEAYHQAEYEYYWMLFMQENEMIND